VQPSVDKGASQGVHFSVDRLDTIHSFGMVIENRANNARV
jgi:hypothetical protein